MCRVSSTQVPAEDNGTFNSGSPIMDSGVSGSMLTVQQPATTSTIQTQQFYQIQPITHIIENQIPISSTIKSFKKIKPKKQIETVTSYRAISPSFETLPQVTFTGTSEIITKLNGTKDLTVNAYGGTKDMPVSAQDGTKDMTVSADISSASVVPSLMPNVDDIPNFETLINSCEVSEMRDHDYAVPILESELELVDDEFIKQLTEALEQASSLHCQPTQHQNTIPSKSRLRLVTDATVSTKAQLEVPSTPTVLRDMLSLDEDEGQHKSKLLSSVSEFCASLKAEQSWEHTSPRTASSPGTDSDYESIYSPASDISDSSDSHYDCSSFNELFPSLF